MRQWAAGESTGLLLEWVYRFQRWCCYALSLERLEMYWVHLYSSRNICHSLTYVITSKILSGQENTNLLGWEGTSSLCHNIIMLKPNTVMQCHNTGLSEGTFWQLPSTYAKVECQVENGLYTTTLITQFCHVSWGKGRRVEWSWKWKQGNPNFIRIFGSPDLITQGLFCRTSLLSPPNRNTFFLGSKVILTLEMPY